MSSIRKSKEVSKLVDKNVKKQKAKKNRVYFPMNTGIRTHKDKKHPDRKALKKRLDKYGY